MQIGDNVLYRGEYEKVVPAVITEIVCSPYIGTYYALIYYSEIGEKVLRSLVSSSLVLAKS